MFETKYCMFASIKPMGNFKFVFCILYINNKNIKY